MNDKLRLLLPEGSESEPVPSVAIAPDIEFEAALTDLALAARVLGNLSKSLDVVLDRLSRTEGGPEPASGDTAIPASQ